MKQSGFLALIIIVSLSAFIISCSSSAKLTSDNGNKEDVSKWYKSNDWLKGLKLKPHESVNQQEFSRQYHLNNVWWDEAINFLKTRDLPGLKPGSYVIDSGNVIATVTELNPKERNEVNFEAHHNFNDLQYIITGKTQMGIAAISDPGAKVTVPYASKSDTETFAIDNGKYYDAEPGTFFIFSPKEIHRPAFKVAGYDLIKKIVIKVRVPQ